MSNIKYRGRFAPSPSGLLHAGSLATALGSWLDARAANGDWLIRMEDLDTHRNQPGADEKILGQLAQFGLISDEPVIRQSSRLDAYQKALDQLIFLNLAYPCRCSRKSIEDRLLAQGIHRGRHQDLVYPGFCRDLFGENAPNPHIEACAWRAKTPDISINGQDLAKEVGDFVLKRADGIFSYQLAVVVDDAAQKITHVVRGMDLLDNTPRQIWLQEEFAYLTPKYIHLPLVVNSANEKLSKQTHASAVLPKSKDEVLVYLNQVASHLGLHMPEKPSTLAEWLLVATQSWQNRSKTF
jgi:glutamyl-Q tRNA(Asp) synthetase